MINIIITIVSIVSVRDMVILIISFIGFTRSLGKGSASGSEPEACALSQDALSEARSQAAFF